MLVESIAAIYRRLPIKGGQTKLSFNRPLNYLMKKFQDPLPATLWNGSVIDVDPDDYHGRILYLFGTNDIKVSLNTNIFLRSGDVFLDIGANYSSIGLQAAAAVGSGGVVHLFEPQRHLVDRVQAMIVQSGLTQVNLHPCGLMDEDATLTIRTPAHHSGRASFASHNNGTDFDHDEVCQVCEIGAYVGPLVANRSFGVKLDIEGSEQCVMPWLVAQPNLRFLIFEANHNHDELMTIVEAAGLHLFGLERNALLLRLSRIESRDDMTGFHDLIALRLKPDAVVPSRAHPSHYLPLMADALS